MDVEIAGIVQAFSDDSDNELALIVLEQEEQFRQVRQKAAFLGMHDDLYLNREPYRTEGESGIEWVEKTLRRRKSCFKMFRMRPYVFEVLNDVLVHSYGLMSTTKMSSRESLAMFLWMLGAPQSMRQAEDRLRRSLATCSTKFSEVLECVVRLAKDVVRPRDPTYSSVHPRVANHKYGQCFSGAIGALDGTHVKVCVPGIAVGKYINRKSEKSQNVLCICDFDRRYTFVAAGIPGSAHDYRVLSEAISKYGANFPHPPPG